MAETITIHNQAEWQDFGLDRANHYFSSNEMQARGLIIRAAAGLAFLVGPETLQMIRTPYVGEDYGLTLTEQGIRRLGITAAGAKIAGKRRPEGYGLELTVSPETRLTATLSQEGLSGVRVATLEEIAALQDNLLTDELMLQIDQSDII